MTWNWCAKCLSIPSDDGDGVQVEAIYLLEEEAQDGERKRRILSHQLAI